MTQSGQTGYRAAPTASSGGSMSIRAQGGFGIDDLTRLLGDSKRYEVFNFWVYAVAGENAVKPGALVERLGVGERLPLVNTASNAVLTPDELLADKSLLLRKSRRDLVEVRKAFVFADRRGQFVANDCGYHGDLLPVTKINNTDNKLGGWKTELLPLVANNARHSPMSAFGP